MDNTYRDMMMAWRVCLSKNWYRISGARGATDSPCDPCGQYAESCIGSFRFKHFTDVCLCALSFMQQTSVCAHSLC
jgi:hypothetical protein